MQDIRGLEAGTIEEAAPERREGASSPGRR